MFGLAIHITSCKLCGRFSGASDLRSSFAHDAGVVASDNAPIYVAVITDVLAGGAFMACLS